jgi:hypothetical protein
VTLGTLKLLPVRLLVTSVQVTPLSIDAERMSVELSALLNVAVMVCAAVLVM